MADPSSTVLFDLDVDQCYKILDDVISHILSSSQDKTEKPSPFLEKYFHDNRIGQCFRSMIVRGKEDGDYISLAYFNKFIMRPRSSHKLQLHSSLLPSVALITIRHEKCGTPSSAGTVCLGNEMIEEVFKFVCSVHPRGNENIFFSRKGIPLPLAWKNGILGIKLRNSTLLPSDLPSMHVLQLRILLSIEFSFELKITKPFSRFLSSKSGNFWKNTPPTRITVELDFHQTTLEAITLFPAYLEHLLRTTGKTLDQLAGVVIEEKYPQVLAAITQLLDQAPAPSVKKHDLKTGPGSDAVLGGTVIAIHQHLSAAFVAYYLVDHDSVCTYMQDRRSAHKKDRKIRVASIHHVSTKPIWIQFGSEDNMFLYLSRKVSAAEEKWLLIVNHVMQLLVIFVNAHLKRVSPRPVQPEKLMRIRHYDTLVENTGNPRTGNYGIHDDAKPGLVDPSNPAFSPYQLMVPTLCLQNHAASNTSISWFPKKEPSWCAGTITQELFLFHIQCVGVQEHFQHAVRYYSASVFLVVFLFSFSNLLTTIDSKGDHHEYFYRS